MVYFLTLLIDNKEVVMLITILLILYWLWDKVRKELNEKKKELMSNILINKVSINSFKNEIEQKLTYSPNLYKEELNKVLGFLEKHLEPLKLFSIKAFEKHFIFSLIYSFFFFYLVWLFGGDGNIGVYQLILNENRLGTSLYLIFEIVTLYFLFAHGDKIQKFLRQKIPSFSRLSNTWRTLLVVVVVVVGVVGGVGVGEVVVFTVVLLVIGAIGGSGLVGLGGVEIFLNGFNSLTMLYLLFFLILPFLNSIFDYLSMLTSRYFAQKILYKHTKKLEIFWDIFLDLIVAAILFITLAFSLYYLIDFINIYFIKDERLFIPIKHYKDLLLSWNLLHPDILWITLMFVSTLIPTLIHLYLFLYSFIAFVIVKPHLHCVVETLDKLDQENQHKKDLVAYDLADYKLTNYLNIHIGAMVVLIIWFVVLFLRLILGL